MYGHRFTGWYSTFNWCFRRHWSQRFLDFLAWHGIYWLGWWFDWGSIISITNSFLDVCGYNRWFIFSKYLLWNSVFVSRLRFCVAWFDCWLLGRGWLWLPSIWWWLMDEITISFTFRYIFIQWRFLPSEALWTFLIGWNVLFECGGWYLICLKSARTCCFGCCFCRGFRIANRIAFHIGS